MSLSASLRLFSQMFINFNTFLSASAAFVFAFAYVFCSC